MNTKNSEIKQAVRQIINESLENDRSNFDGTAVFNISRYVEGLIAEGQNDAKLMSYLTNFKRRIDKGGREWMMFEEFGQGLAQFATGNKSVKNVINEMNQTLADHSVELEGFKIIESVADDYVRESLTTTFNEYIADPCDDTKANILESIDNLFNVNTEAAMRMTLIVTDSSQKQPELFRTRNINESEQYQLNKKLEENRKERMANDIFAKVERYLDKIQKSEDEAQIAINETYSLDGIANKNGLNLLEHLKKVTSSDANKNVALSKILEQYTNALEQGAYEERLYETLLQNTSKFNYLLPVDKMRKAIMETVDEKYEEITLTKLLEMMRDNYSSYIYVELIQEDVARYVKNPNATNRVQLRNALMPYAHDPYINEMFRIIYNDDRLSANSLSEKALTIKDQIDLIRQDTTVSNIYTPVQFIHEGESVFNVHGQYYVKKNNTIAALDKKYISKLDERFVEMCRLVNDPRVDILEDRIILTGSDQYATIYEGYVDIDGCHESAESLRNLNEMCTKYGNYDTNFFIMCSCLLENFDNIAKIDWAKHVVLNSDNNISADLFKLDENIYMALHNNSLNSHTFYRNVNPLFCKNTLNEHMGINVASLFSDMLPEQDKIILRLNETNNEYVKSIEEYEKMIADLEDALEDAASEELKTQIKNTIEDTQKKLDDVKTEYKEWQKTTDEMIADSEETDSDEEQQTVTKEESNEPLDADEVEQMKAELSTPLTQTGEETPNEGEAEASQIADELNDEISDDEFSDMLATDATGETVNPDEDIEIDTDIIDNTPDNGFDFDEPADQEEFQTVPDEEVGDELGDEEDIFDEPDEVPAVAPAEETSDDEDIIIGDEEDEEIPVGDMKTVDAETGEEIGTEATDIFGGNVSEPVRDMEEENELFNPGTSTSEYNIVNVMFDSNVQDNTVMKSGEAMVLCPMVEPTGRLYTKEIKVKFYLNADNTPVIQADSDMSNSMYNDIRNAITSHPQFNDVVEHGIEVSGVDGEFAAEPVKSEDWEKEYAEEANAEDKGEFLVGSDELGDEGSEIPDVIDTDEIDRVSYDDFILGDEEPVADVPAETPAAETPAVSVPDETFDFTEIFPDSDEETDTPVADTELTVDPVDTYTDAEGTEIEVPAPVVNGEETPEAGEEKSDETEEEKPAEVADDVIPENFSRNVSKEQVNENRKAILSVRKK